MSVEMWGWGVDVSTYRIAVGAVSTMNPFEPARAWHFDVDRKLDLPHRLQEIRWGLCSMEVHRPPLPLAVVVENPVIRRFNFGLVAAAGVTIEALSAAYEVPVLELAVPTWKKEVLGNGSATKEDIAAFAEGIGWRGEVQDEADAVCIAVAAVNRLRKAGA